MHHIDRGVQYLSKWSDIAGLIAFAAFGLWWIAFPRSVIRFYMWFHRGRMRLPRPAGVRVAGALWVALVLVVWWLRRGA